jgi:hypothetical protein
MREIFSFHNASPQLTCKILSEAVHRHNMDCTNSLRSRPRIYFHYDTWIYDRLQILTRDLFGPENMLFPDWINTREFQVAESTVGIAKLSDSLREQCGMEEYNENDWPKEKSQMQFMAKRLGTKKPILPVHTRQERNLFNKLEPRYIIKKEVPDAMVKAWNEQASKTSGVYYKTSSLLTKYYNKYIVTDSLRSLTMRNHKMPALKDRMGTASGSQPTTLPKDHAWRPVSAVENEQAAISSNQTQAAYARGGNVSSSNTSSSQPTANNSNSSAPSTSNVQPSNTSNVQPPNTSNVRQSQAAIKPVVPIVPAANICYVPITMPMGWPWSDQSQLIGNNFSSVNSASATPLQITDRTVKKVKQSFSPIKGESQGMKGPVAIGPIAGNPTIATLNFGGEGSKASTSRKPRKCAICWAQFCKGTGGRKHCPWVEKDEGVQELARQINRTIPDENERAKRLIELLNSTAQGVSKK